MTTLNIPYPEKGNIQFKLQKFPDGQNNTVINIKTIPENTQEIRILSRLNNWIDVEILICIVKCLNELGYKRLHLFNPMFLGARSDRKFEEGGNWYLKQVICPIINSLNFESVTVLDAHSYVLGNLLTNYKAIDNSQLISFSVRDILINNDNAHIKDIIYIAPDAGASHKIYKSLEAANIEDQDIIICSKERDAQGNLTQTKVPLRAEAHKYKDFIIIDDICDGGRTFINIAKELKEYLKRPTIKEFSGKIYLIITHGIFSAGFKELSQYFDGIYCTNSYSNIGDYAGNDMEKTNVKQLNVF